MPQDERLRAHCERVWMRIIREEGLEFLGWRSVPVDNACLSEMVKATEPVHRQIFIGAPEGDEGPGRVRAPALSHPQGRLQRHLRRLQGPRHRPLHGVAVEPHAGLQGHVPVLPGEGLLQRTCPTRASPRRWRSCTSASPPTPSRRGSWRTPTAWSPTTARSTRCAATSTGWRRGRRRCPRRCSATDISKLWPISYEGQSDTACFDNALEFLVMGGYSLAHAAMMLIPEAWAGNPLMDGKRRAFYEYHACLMEPWDGPAAMAFTDGRQIGATLDRNGLRPARYLVTKDDRVIMSSEAGVLPVPEENIAQKWRLQPGKMLLIDLEEGPHHLRRRPEGRSRLALSLRAVAEAHADPGRRPAAAQEGRAQEDQRRAARSAAGVRLHAGEPQVPDGADGAHRPGGGRLDGHRHAGVGAVEQAQAAAHLLQAELRAGDEPADRLDPRGAGDEPRLVHRAAAEPARSGRHRQASSGSRCTSRSSPTRTWSASARSAW